MALLLLSFALLRDVGRAILLMQEVNKEAVALAEQYQMKPMFETARMYTKAPPDGALNKLFGVTSFE